MLLVAVLPVEVFFKAKGKRPLDYFDLLCLSEGHGELSDRVRRVLSSSGNCFDSVGPTLVGRSGEKKKKGDSTHFLSPALEIALTSKEPRASPVFCP